MPKAQKSLQTASDTKSKQITDFFPRKPILSNSCASRPAAVSQKHAKQLSAKEIGTPITRSSHLQAKQGEPLPNVAAPSDSQETRTGSPLPTRAVHITSLAPPSTKRLRSQSVISSQSNKTTRWPNNILRESKFEEEKMEVDDSLVVHVRSEAATLPSSSLLQVPPSDKTRRKKYRFSASPDRQLEVSSLVPSSLSEERELAPGRPEQKDIGAIKEAVDHWRQQALPPSPSTNVNSPVEPKMMSQPDPQPSTVCSVDWNMAVDSVYGATPSRPSTSTATASIPTPPSTGGPDDMHLASPVEILDANTKTEQIIRDIKARALAQSRTQEPSSPLSSIASLDGSDDEDDDLDVLAGLGLGNNSKLKSSLQARTPTKPARYNLRKPAAKIELSKQGPALSSRRDTPPAPPLRRKPTVNPLDALLKEERAINGRNGIRSADREAQLRDLASMNLDNESDDDVNLNKPKAYVPMTSDDDGNPFIDDNQKEQVLEILQGDKLIEDEEEHLRQQGEVGVALWGPSESCTMNSYDDALPRLGYQGSDPTLQTFTQTIAHGDRALVQLVIQAGALELADYADGGLDVIDWLINLAISFRSDNLDLYASQILPNVLNNTTFITPVPLFECTLSTLHTLGAEPSTLERLGWVINEELRNMILNDERCIVIERLVFCIMNVAKSRRLHRREIPDILVVLLLIGMEPSLSPEMKLQVSRVIHEVCESIGEPSHINAEVESAICNKVLHLVQPYTLQNKFYTLSFLSSGSGRVARVARSVAHAMLTDKSALLLSQYSALPPLSEIMVVLGMSSQDSLCPVGKFEIHEGTNYVEMACWTFVLAIAITDIPQYLEQEESGRSMSSPSKSPAKDRDQSLVFALYEKLYKIHGRIQDTRAAHLDRSRTKAILFQTAFRILYQYQAVVQHRRKSNHNIQSYFRRK